MGAKEDFLFILWQRGFSINTLKKETVDQLFQRTGMLTPLEKEKLLERKIYHEQRKQDKLEDLKKECKLRGIPSSNSNKTQLLDLLMMNKTLKYELTLDPDQEKLVHGELVRKKYISAGPGSGKTTALVHLVQRWKHLHCLILAFNRAARENIVLRLKKLSVSLGKKSSVFTEKNVYIMTFDEFAYQVCKKHYTFYKIVDFAETKRKALLYLKKLSFQFDLLVIDEGQDLSDVLGEMVHSIALHSSFLYIFGDPRQELYPGCHWFSLLWKNGSDEEKSYLHYNHRSGRKIVEFLNTFSRINFPSLHFDQICTSKEDGEVSLFNSHQFTEETGLQEISYAQSCFLAPISIRKYGLEDKTTRLRQIVYEKVSLAPRVMDAEEQEFDIMKECIIATSKKFKGLEKDIVYVYGVDINYSINIPWESLVKSLFVCLSRAKEKLYIIFNAQQMKLFTSPLSIQLLSSDLPPPLPDLSESFSFKPPCFSIKDLFEMMDCFPIPDQEESLVTNFEVNQTLEPQMDGDFLNIYVTNYVASELECLKVGKLCNIDEKLGRKLYESKFGRYAKKAFLGHQEDYYFYSLKMSPSLEKTLHEMNPYDLSVVDYSNKINTLWTVSERLKNSAPDITHFLPLVQNQKWTFKKTFRKILETGRSTDLNRTTMVEIIGSPDFYSHEQTMNIHYVSEILPQHKCQASLLSWLMDLESIQLVDLKKGSILSIPAMKDPTQYIHASIILRQAQQAHLKLKRWVTGQSSSNVCIAIDFETLGFNNALITEIGAVKYNPSTRTILDIYYATADGIGFSENSQEEWSQITGIVIEDFPKFEACQTSLSQNLREWCGEEATIIHWGGSESKFFKNTLDIYRLYLNWSDLMGCKLSAGNTLGNACDRLFCGNLPFTPHRAFDDALATMAVHVAITSYGGAL